MIRRMCLVLGLLLLGAWGFQSITVRADDKPSKKTGEQIREMENDAKGMGTLAGTLLPQDPNNTYGEFANGFRYIIRPNTNPPGKVALWLHVRTGALNEKEDQNGIAHFLEHMAFNGSKNFPAGKLIPFLNEMGMEFGHHTNAHTSIKETVFKLLMPKTDSETVDKGLTVLDDFAEGLLLTQEEIDKERGVVLEEARSDKGADERIMKMWRKNVFAGSRLAEHDVIGNEDQITKWNRVDVLDYWNTWYRPENMTLLVVGDVKVEDVRELAKKHFESMAARAPAREAGKTGIQPVTQARAYVLTDPEQVEGRVQVLALHPARPRIRTYEDYRFNEIENMGTWIVTRRLDEMINRGTADFREGQVWVGDIYNEGIMAVGQTVGEPEDWNKMLDQTVAEVHRAVEHGFTERELQLVRKEFLASAERSVELESTRDSWTVVSELSETLTSEYPILSAQQNLDLMKKVLEEATLKEIHDVLVKDFKNNDYTYVMTMPKANEELTLPTPQEALAAATTDWSRETEAPKQEQLADNILPELPTPGAVANQKTDSDLKVTTTELSNGVIVHHRFMDYRKDMVLVTINLAGGTIEETPANRGISEAAALVNATSRLTSNQIRDIMTGKKVKVAGQARFDLVTLAINGSPKDLDSGFQLAYAMLTDGKIEPSALDNWKQFWLQQLEEIKTMPQGQLQLAMDQTFYGGDVRLSLMTPDQVKKVDLNAAEAWWKHLTDSAPIEVAIVGDISLEDATNLATRYLGSLPKRSLGYEGLDALRKIKRGNGPFEKAVKFETVTPVSAVLTGFVGCDYDNIPDRRALNLITKILDDRMNKRIREDEQLVYSISCVSDPSVSIPGLGMLVAQSTTDPQKADKLADTVLSMMKDFVEKGPTDDELEVAKKQMSNQLEVSMKEPGFWLAKIDELKYRNRTLDELKELPGAYQKITAEQLQSAARKYMTDNKRIRLVAIPDVKETPAEKEKEQKPAPAPAGK